MPQKKTYRRPDTSAQPTTSPTRRRTREVQLVIPAGQADRESLLAAVREWLVPVMVQQFLKERGIETQKRSNRCNPQKSVYRTPLQGAHNNGD